MIAKRKTDRKIINDKLLFQPKIALTNYFECFACKKTTSRESRMPYIIHMYKEVVMIEFLCPECNNSLRGYEYEYIFFKGEQ